MKENAMILAKTRKLLAGVAAAAVIVAFGFAYTFKSIQTGGVRPKVRFGSN